MKLCYFKLIHFFFFNIKVIIKIISWTVDHFSCPRGQCLLLELHSFQTKQVGRKTNNSILFKLKKYIFSAQRSQVYGVINGCMWIPALRTWDITLERRSSLMSLNLDKPSATKYICNYSLCYKSPYTVSFIISSLNTIQIQWFSYFILPYSFGS